MALPVAFPAAGLAYNFGNDTVDLPTAHAFNTIFLRMGSANAAADPPSGGPSRAAAPDARVNRRSAHPSRVPAARDLQVPSRASTESQPQQA